MTLSNFTQLMTPPRSPDLLEANEISVISEKASTFIYSLTPDVLAIIFKIGQALAIQTPDDTPLLQGKPFEIIISHVSSHFRYIAIGLHTLWMGINIAPTYPMEQVVAYLSRSGSCGLDIGISLGDTWNPSIMMGTVAKFNKVSPHLHRCRRLSIDITYASWENPVIRCLGQMDAPILEHLSISVNNVDGFNAVNIMSFGGGAQKLSFVRLRGLAMALFRPPLDNITTLHLDQTIPLPIHYNTLRQMLIASPSLTNLSLYGDIIETQTWPSTSHSPIEMPHLRCLRVCGVSGTIYSGLLLAIDAPELMSLVLQDVQEYDMQPFWASPDMFKFPHIKHLTFYDFEPSSDAYEKIFQAFPAVTTFTVAQRLESPRILTRLAEPTVDVNNAPWPNLHTLALSLGFCDDDLVVDVITQRKVMKRPLSKLRLDTVNPLPCLQQYDWLVENVAMEAFHRFDEWPDAHTCDQNDDLFM